MRNTCFVISPIGKEGTDARREADEFLDFLIEPALEKFNFDVHRADKIPRPTTITADIIRLVQEADLCIIDITNSNPNVFYECGRRHETGRPFIQMVRSGKMAEIPFDVAGIRTVEYDLSTTAKARTSIKDLQVFIGEIIKSGFGDKAAGYTLASVGDAIDRLERRVNNFLVSHSVQSTANSKTKVSKIDIITSHPEKAFTSLLEEADFPGAFAVLSRVKAASSTEEYLRCVGLLARAGYESAKDLLIDIVSDMVNNPQMSHRMFESVVYAIKDYYNNIGRSAEGISFFEKLFTDARDVGICSEISLASLANIVGMLAWLIDNLEIEQKYQEIAILLDPDTPAYWYNKALTHEKGEQRDELLLSLRGLARAKPIIDVHFEILNKYGISI